MINVTEWTCPRGHIALMVPWNPDVLTREVVEQVGQEQIFDSKALPKNCRYCGEPVSIKHYPVDMTMGEAIRYSLAVTAVSALRLRSLREVLEGLRN